MNITRRFRFAATAALLLGIAAVPAHAALTWQLHVVDSGGQYTSLRLDSRGFPVISYYDVANLDLKLVHCGDAVCSSGNTIQTVDSVGLVGQHSSLALDSRGFPVISYYDATNQDLKVAHCGDAACASGNSIQTVDSGGSVGQYTSIKLDGGGNPVVSYLDMSNGDLKLLHCGDANCVTGNSIQTVDAVGNVGYYSSLAIDAAGRPVISYLSQTPHTPGALKVAHCGDANCAGAKSVQTVDSALPTVGFNTSLALDPVSGVPVVAYYGGSLKLLRCGDADCSAGNSIQQVDSPSAGAYASLALDSAGIPNVSYFAGSSPGLRFARCGDAACASGNSIATVDNTPNSGRFTSLALDGDGNPVISYIYFVSSLGLARLGIDVTPPSVTLNQSIEDPTFSNSIRFAVTFSEPVTGFSGAGVIVSGTAGATTARVTSGSPDKRFYIVTVTGMTASGTVTASVRANSAVDAAGLGNTSSTSSDNTVTYIRDITPPTCVVSVSLDTLWPPNHRMVDIVTSVTVSDSGSGPNGGYLSSVVSSEPEFGLASDDVPVDINYDQFNQSNPMIVQLRSERYAKEGRTYTITYTAGDVVGNTSTCSATVKVPLSQK